MGDIGRPVGQQYVGNRTLQAMERADKSADIRQEARQEASEDRLQDQYARMNPFARGLKKMRNPLKKRTIQEPKKVQEKQGKQTAKSEKVRDCAQKFEKQNPELKKDSLMLLRENLKEGMSKEELLEVVQKFYPDKALADEALEFLAETTEGEMQQTVHSAKKTLNDDFGQEVRAGRNMGKESREFAEKDLGSPMALRDLYRDITTNPREPRELFNEFSEKFEYEQLKDTIKFLLHSLGSDFKAKGPSIERGELHRLMTETKTLQAILGVYRFFRQRMNLVKRMFEKHGLKLTKKISFKTIAKLYMNLLENRYPSPEKVLELAKKLDIDQNLLAQIIVFTQMRDAIRQTAPKLYRSEDHKQELWLALIESLDDLEVELEEEEDQEWEEEEWDAGDDENDDVDAWDDDDDLAF